MANMDFKERPLQTELMSFTTLRRGHVTPCALTVPVHKPQFPRSLGGSSNHIASRPVMNLGTLSWVFPGSSLSTSKCKSPAQTEGSRAHWALHMKPRVLKSLKQPHGTEGCQLCLTQPTAQYKMWTLNHLPYYLLLIVIMKLITWCLFSKRSGFASFEDFSKPKMMNSLMAELKAL